MPAYIRMGSMVALHVGQYSSNPVNGTCDQCGRESILDPVMLHVGQIDIRMSHVCGHCGYITTLMEGATHFLTCEPITRPEPTLPGSLDKTPTTLPSASVSNAGQDF